MEVLNRLLGALTAKRNLELHPTTFAENDSKNIQEWIKNFKRIATHSQLDEQKQHDVIPLYLKKAAIFHHLCKA